MVAYGKDNKQTQMKIIQQDVSKEDRKLAFSFEKQRNLVLNIVRRPPGTSLEFDISLTAGSLLITYQVEFIAIIQRVLQDVSLDEKASNAAIEAYSDFKNVTSSQLEEMIYKKANKVEINIGSPMLLLPQKVGFDINEPCWLMRLGDFTLKTTEHLGKTLD